MEQAALPLQRERGEDAYALRERLGELTWRQVGLVRDGSGLQDALQQLDDLYERTGKIAVNPGRRLNGEWQQALDVRNLTEVARLIARAALVRQESRGSHYRADFPQTDDAHWLKNIYLHRTGSPNGSGPAPAAAEVEIRAARLSRLHPPGHPPPAALSSRTRA
jgi:succinate dehydrogenase / fumarate reductase flavoprotein subunit/fumarate reductase flavoprotein subunit